MGDELLIIFVPTGELCYNEYLHLFFDNWICEVAMGNILHCVKNPRFADRNKAAFWLNRIVARYEQVVPNAFSKGDRGAVAVPQSLIVAW